MAGLRAFVSLLVAAASCCAADGVTVVAHRGAMKLAPENTLASLRKAVESGADLVEMDVRQTLDGHLILMHDARLERTTNGEGLVARMPLAELRLLDAGSWFAPAFAGQRVPTLEEALSALEGKALPAIDFKAGDPARLVAALGKFHLPGKITLYCENEELLRRTLRLSPAFLARPDLSPATGGLATAIAEFDPPLINLDWPQFSRELVSQVRASGRQAFVNSMGAHDTEAGLLEVIESGASYIQTDRLDLLLPMLRSRGLHR